MPTQAPLIEMQHADIVSANTGVVMVREVDWQIGAGEFWIVGGPYGSGKTDLLSTAAAIQRAAAGHVCLFGADVAEAPEPEIARLRRRIGLVFKFGGRMFANFTVQENVALPLRYHENLGPVEAAARTESLLQMAGLTSVAKKIAGTLAPHLRIRIGLARALALDPEVLFLDEPLAGVDIHAHRWMLDFFKTRKAAGKPQTIVVGTNNFEPWLELGTRFGVLKHNRWLAFAGREELKDAMLETTATEF